MKVAIYGQYYQNSTEPIIRDIFVFFNDNHVEMVIEEAFLKLLYEKEITSNTNYSNFSFVNENQPESEEIIEENVEIMIENYNEEHLI